jgi:hypothetical protein
MHREWLVGSGGWLTGRPSRSLVERQIDSGCSSFASQTTTAAGRHIVSNPIRSSKRYELTATSATSLNQAQRGAPHVALHG